MASSKDKEQYIYNSSGYSKEDGSQTDLSSWANKEISESKKAYDYYDSMGNTKGEDASHDRAEYARNLLGYYSDDAGNQMEIDSMYINNKIAEEQKKWADAYANKDQLGMDASHAAAQRYRQMLGYAASEDDGTGQITQEELANYVNTQIEDAKTKWQAAYETGDQNGMASAHYQAEKARAMLGYSGGDDGTGNMNIYNGANYQNDVDTPFVANVGAANSTSEQPGQRYKVSLGGKEYFMDNEGNLYDSYQEGNMVGNGWNSSTSSLTYSDDQQARDSALKILEERYGVKGWDEVLTRMGLDSSEIPDDLLEAAKSGTLLSYINNLEQKNQEKASGNSDLMSIIQQLISNQNNYASPANWNNPETATGSLVSSTGTNASGYAPQSSLGNAAGKNLLDGYLNPYKGGR